MPALNTGHRFEVLPLYAQVDIRDPAATDYPQWDSGDERAVATTHCIAVSTRRDRDGTVTLEVHKRTPPPNAGSLIHDGTLLLTGGDVVVGNLIAGDVHTIGLGSGQHRVQIYVEPLDEPARVVVVFDADPHAPEAEGQGGAARSVTYSYEGIATLRHHEAR